MKRRKELIWLFPPVAVIVSLLMIKGCSQRINEGFSVVRIERKGGSLLVPPVSVVEREKNGRKYHYIYMINNENKVTEREVARIEERNGKVRIFSRKIMENEEIIEMPNESIKDKVIVRRKNLNESKEEIENKLQKLQKEIEKKKKEIEADEIEVIRLKRKVRKS